MIQHKLNLNDDKTEAMVAGSRSCTSLIHSQTTEIGGNHIPFSTCVQGSGFHNNNTLAMHQHLIYLRPTPFLAPIGIASIRSYLTVSTTDQLVSAFVTSRLDYSKSMFAGLPATEINRLQRIQKPKCSQIGCDEIKERPRFTTGPAFTLATHYCTN